MADNLFCPPCIDDYCADTAVLPGLDYEDYCEETNDDLISEVFYTDQAHPLEGDVSLAATWAARLSNTSDGSGSAGNVAHPIRSIKVPRFTRPRVDAAYKTSIDGKRSIAQPTDRRITGLIDDTSTRMQNLMTALQCNGDVLFWYRAGKYIYGGSGIAGSMQPKFGITDEDGFAHKWGLDVLWKAKCDEPRVLAAI